MPVSQLQQQRTAAVKAMHARIAPAPEYRIVLSSRQGMEQ